MIARNSSFTDKNRDVDARQIANELGVRPRRRRQCAAAREAERVRVTVQLIEGETGVNLWAETFEASATGIFADLQGRHHAAHRQPSSSPPVREA